MREIKFRVWDKNQNKMYPLLEIIPKTKTVVQDSMINSYQFFEIMELMQFTGLKDKNGKEIFEGDVLKTIICKSFGKNDVWYFCTYLVEIEQDYNYGYKFNWKRIKTEKILTKTKEDYKRFGEYYKEFGKGEIVIGNIYENSKLLNDVNHAKVVEK